MGAPVTVIGVDIPAGVGRGLVAICRRDGAEYEVSLLDVVVRPESDLARIVTAYRHWCDLDPWPKVVG